MKRCRFALDPDVTFLNHGSFGACPRVVLAEQQRLRERLEAEPVRFLAREYEPLLDAARHSLGSFLGCNEDDLGFVTNATTAVNCVLRSLVSPGDELLITSHGYNACNNVMRFVAERSGARITVANVPPASVGRADRRGDHEGGDAEDEARVDRSHHQPHRDRVPHRAHRA